jgi:hypothetical protein
VTRARSSAGLLSEYVSTDCPSGQITLTLARDGGFTLALAIWDPVVCDHVGWRTLTGRWTLEREHLVLAAHARNLSYCVLPEGEAEVDGEPPVAALHWERSNLPTFADGFDLVARS